MPTKLILTKESSESEIKAYFNAVLRLSQSDNEFPINLDEVWPLVYSEKGKATRALKNNFIENVDYILLAQNGKRDGSDWGGSNKTDYYLSLSCMEYFIARKVRPVFEVYRQVFHKTSKALSSDHSMTQAEMFLQIAQMNVENERKMKALEARTEELRSELTEIKQRTTTDLRQSTIVAFVSRNKIALDVSRYGAMGRKATNICKKRGIAVTKINDVRWGKVSVYPDEVLEEVFGVKQE